MTPSAWRSTGKGGSLFVMASGYLGVLAVEGLNYAGIRYQGTALIQNVPTRNSTIFNLMFSARNAPSMSGGVAPLLVYQNSTLVGAVTPSALEWTNFQMQFSLFVPANYSGPVTMFQLIFQVGSVPNDVFILLDNITLLSDSCTNCEVTRCPAGTYFLGGGSTGCGSLQSCITCPSGYYCPGGVEQPHPCGIGTFNSVVGMRNILACLNCTLSCERGSYLASPCSTPASTVASTCVTCPSGSYCLGNIDPPVLCPNFAVSPPGAFSVTQCISPTYGGLIPVGTVNSSFSGPIFSVVAGLSGVYSSDASGYAFQFYRNPTSGALTSGTPKSMFMGNVSGFLSLSPDAVSLYRGTTGMFSFCAISSLTSFVTSCSYLDTDTFPIKFPILTVYVSPDSLSVYTGDVGGQIIMYPLGAPTNPTLVAQSMNSEMFTSIQISNDWQYFYAASFVSSSMGYIYQFTRYVDGTLGPLGFVNSFALDPPEGALSMAIDPSGRILYVLGTKFLRNFLIQSNGVLTGLPFYPSYRAQLASQISSPLVPQKFVMSFETYQRSIYICNASGSLLVFAPIDGSLQVSSVQFIINGVDCNTLAVAPNGDFVYVGTKSNPGQLKTFSRVIPCQTGQYKLQNTCFNCPNNTYSAAGNTDSSCFPCGPNFFKPDPSRMLNNSDFEFDNVAEGTSSAITPARWTSGGTTAVVASFQGSFGGMLAKSNLRYVALSGAGSFIQQIVYPQNSTTYHLTFYAANRPNSAGGSAPLAVYANSQLLGFVSPINGVWRQFQFQFSVAFGLNSFILQFMVGSFNPGDVTIFVDQVILLSNKCVRCTTYNCSAGNYLADLPCGSVSSCVTCPAGSSCKGGITQPKICPVNTYSFSGSTSCTLCLYNCTRGTYVSGSCASPGSVAPTRCIICPSGFYCPGGNSSLPCPYGTYSLTGSYNISQCVVPSFGGLTFNDSSIFVSSNAVYSMVAISAAVFMTDSFVNLYQLSLDPKSFSSSLLTSVRNAPAGITDYSLVIKPDTTALYHGICSFFMACFIVLP
jgi:hypothetical protein